MLLRLLLIVCWCTSAAQGYTVLTHQAIIDAVWEDTFKPALLKRFPAATPGELVKAHAYAYGGCIIQDMGYQPFSSRFFSDLTHYVRSGDFIIALIRNAKTIDEYAFALGALEHYVADTLGHRMATNRAVPLLYPKLARQFGADVTFWDNPTAHLRTEFGFDVLQVASHRYAPDSYRDFIGFQVSRELLERAFGETYDLQMKDVFGSVSMSIGTYRYAVRSVLPGMTRVAWKLKEKELKKEVPGITRKSFLYRGSRSSFEKEWGKDYRKPGFKAELLAGLIRVLPKVGPLKSLAFRIPTPVVERLFIASLKSTIEKFKVVVGNVGNGRFELPNENFDARLALTAGKYKGADQAFAKLLNRHAEAKFAGMTPELRNVILHYYKDFNPTGDLSEEKAIAANLARLQAQ